MTVTLQETVWFVLHKEPGRDFRLVEIIEEIEKIRSGYIGSAAVNACLDRLVRSGEVRKSHAPNGASLFQAIVPPR